MGDISQNDQAETSETVDGDVITAADVASLNGIAVARAAAFCRIAGTVVVVVGLVGAVSWLWLAVRTQQRIDGGGGSDLSFESARPSLVERVDYLSGTMSLAVWAALTAGAGLFLRLGADYAVARTGGTLTGFNVGDAMPDGEFDAADELDAQF